MLFLFDLYLFFRVARGTPCTSHAPQALSDIEIATSLLKNADASADVTENPVDTHYKVRMLTEIYRRVLAPHDASAHLFAQMLKCELRPLDKNSETFKILNKYVQQTHAPTHSNYTLEVLEIFEVISRILPACSSQTRFSLIIPHRHVQVERQGDKDRFKAYAGLHNHQLLWHGSRLTNW
jgi:poly [ADP-ribose] polymerase